MLQSDIIAIAICSQCSHTCNSVRNVNTTLQGDRRNYLPITFEEGEEELIITREETGEEFEKDVYLLRSQYRAPLKREV